MSLNIKEYSAAGISAPRTFRKVAAEVETKEKESSDEEVFDAPKKGKGLQGIIEIENPNFVNQKTSLKARDIDIDRTTELSRREREELEKEKSHERYMKRKEQGKTEKARKDLERLTLIRREREEANRKREEEKAAKEAKKADARK